MVLKDLRQQIGFSQKREGMELETDFVAGDTMLRAFNVSGHGGFYFYKLMSQYS